MTFATHTGQRRWRRLIGALALIAVLAACVHPRREHPNDGHDVGVIVGFRQEVRGVAQDRQTFDLSTQYVTSQVLRAANGGPVNILAISGGGAGAAFGAGALVGMSKSGTRPAFQVVTGVSAGALTAPFAFLGPSWDPQLSESFSDKKSAKLIRISPMGVFLAPFCAASHLRNW